MYLFSIFNLSHNKTNIDIAKGEWTHLVYDLTEGYWEFTATISGGTGDGDLYVRHGAESTTSEYDCRPFTGRKFESCHFRSPAAGKWHVDIRGFTAATDIMLQIRAK